MRTSRDSRQYHPALLRKRIGEEHKAQIELMLGHIKTSVSDFYALFDPNMLGLALEATNAIIEEIEALTPGAFHRTETGHISQSSSRERA